MMRRIKLLFLILAIVYVLSIAFVTYQRVGSMMLASVEAAFESEAKEKFAPPPQVGEPTGLAIPYLNIEADVELVGEDKNGAMEVPRDYTKVGWFKYGPKPGEVGTAIMAGHYDFVGGLRGVFYDLKDLRVGDLIKVKTANEQLTFMVEKIESVPYDQNLDEIYVDDGTRRLNLVTCSGSWLKHEHTYTERLVVYTRLTTQ